MPAPLKAIQVMDRMQGMKADEAYALEAQALGAHHVEEGQPLLVVEAMKMETAVSAPKAGTVGEVFVREGDAVSVGDALVTIDG